MATLKKNIDPLGIPTRGVLINDNNWTKLSLPIQELVEELLKKQNGKCNISGIEFDEKCRKPFLKSNFDKKNKLPKYELVCKEFSTLKCVDGYPFLIRIEYNNWD